MNTRYLFRGRRRCSGSYNGDWEIGTPRQHGEIHMLNINDSTGEVVEVYTSTMGQCSGLSANKSCRGKEPSDLLVFEGDVISDGRKSYKVIYSLSSAGLLAVDPEGHYYSLYHLVGRGVQIIGTVHDDPVLWEA